MFVLKNWSLHPYRTNSIIGHVYNNPRFDSGEVVTTSRIIALNTETKVITTRNGSEYLLEFPHSEYHEDTMLEEIQEHLKDT